MNLAPEEILERLLPRPRRVEPLEGVCALTGGIDWEMHVEDARVRRAAAEWIEMVEGASVPQPQVNLRIAFERMGRHEHAYALTVRRGRIDLIGESPAGAFHGLQTLRQLVDLSDGNVPCCAIRDDPDFTTRGLLHDVTRGKVPTLATLKLLVNRLAALKCNQLQLYIEHAFTFAFDRDICGPDDGLTPDEIRELDGYCKDRFIDLVPAVATLGHMGRILSMPRYRHLAEIEPTPSWEETPWPQRARGFTLDITNPESHRLVERIWTDILDAFSSPIVNICGDEPWDLGKGKNKDRFAAGSGPPYINHILRTRAICAARGRRSQVWSDVVRNHPELFDRLPRDLTVMHWGYDDKSDYEGTRNFVDAGLNTIVCPGTIGWKRILNAMNLAERNIKAFAEAGKRYGATGLVNTDWGDHGHFNALACSWHGIALGAACAWNADHVTGADFDDAFAATVLGMSDGSVVRSLRDASRIADACETWRLLWQPRQQIAEDLTLPTLERADECTATADRCAQSLFRSKFYDSLDRDELLLACRFMRVFADKVRSIRDADVDPLDLTDLLPTLQRNWLARNKLSGIPDIVQVLRGVESECYSG